MSVELIDPISQVSAKRLPETGSVSDVADELPYAVYRDSSTFLSGAADQVGYVYQELGGNVVDIELEPSNVYTAYQLATLEYNYLINIHNAKNNLNNVLGASTASFNSDGQVTSGEAVGNKYLKFVLGYVNRISDGIAREAGFGADYKEYTASIDLENGVQTYDLQEILQNHTELSGVVGTNKVLIKKIIYKSPYANWRFFSGLYGGYNVVGNLSSYGQFADDSTFEIIPTWQNKLQAMAFQDSLYTRTSHFSYEINNNKIRLYPTPYHGWEVKKLYVFFTVNTDPWVSDPNINEGIDGVSNISNFPVEHLPFESINQIGKQWIRKYALAICKSMLAQVRGKFGVIPIPGGEVTLNHSSLESQGKEEKEALRKELMEILDKMTYQEMMKSDAEMLEAGEKLLKNVPLLIYRL
jgi:hypothetical protein